MKKKKSKKKIIRETISGIGIISCYWFQEYFASKERLRKLRVHFWKNNEIFRRGKKSKLILTLHAWYNSFYTLSPVSCQHPWIPWQVRITLLAFHAGCLGFVSRVGQKFCAAGFFRGPLVRTMSSYFNVVTICGMTRTIKD